MNPDHLYGQLAIYRRNLRILSDKVRFYGGIVQCPTSVVNEINATVGRIVEIKLELRSDGYPVEGELADNGPL